MQDMDTLAPIDSNDQEVVFDSTNPAQGLQVRSGSAPVELGDSSDTEDDKQDHGKDDVEVIKTTTSKPTNLTDTEVTKDDTAATTAVAPPP
jgi:hypothetical protein